MKRRASTLYLPPAPDYAGRRRIDTRYACCTRQCLSVRQDLKHRSFALTTGVLRRFKLLSSGGPAEAHIALQLFRAVSSLGAQLEEAEVFASRRDLAAKLVVALREAREARYWLRLLATNPDRSHLLQPDIVECTEFIAMLTTSVRKLRSSPDT